MEIRTVLVLTDLSEESLTGLRYAYALAERRKAGLVVGHVLVPRTLDSSNVKEFLEQHGFDPASATIDIEVDADVVEGIDMLVQNAHPDLVVLSSYRKRGANRLLFASVPVALVGEATSPVLALHSGHERKQDFRRALVCLDGSDNADALLDAAAGVLAPGGEIVALMVVEDSPLVIAGIHIGTWSEETLAKAKQAAEAHLAKQGAPCGHAFERVVVVGEAVPKIRETRVAKDCDLIVIGSHGVGGSARILLGSVAAGVVRYADVPALVVPTKSGDS